MSEAAEPRAGTNGVSQRGIYDCDDAYRTPSQADYERLFTSGIIALDTNVLLNLYRSNERTRQDTLAVLERLKERIWIPHQVISEFWRNRDLPSVRGHHKTKARDACSALDKTSRAMRDALDRWLRDVHLASDDAANTHINAARDTVTKTLTNMKEFIEAQAKKDALEGTESTQTDPVLQELEPLLEGRIGAPFSDEEYKESLSEAARRTAEKIPPGYEDSSKDPERAAGDYLVWAQLLNEAADRQQEVLLVTGDVKEDWWMSLDGRGPARPRTELRAELKRRAGVNLFMLTPSQLLTQAERVFGLKVDERSVSDLATNEALASVKWPPEELIRAIPQLLSQANERAVEAAKVAGLSDAGRSPYGPVIQAAFLEALKAAASKLGGSSALLQSEVYPIVNDCLLFPYRYSNHSAEIDHGLAYLNNRKGIRRVLSDMLQESTQLSLMDIAYLDPEIPGLYRPSNSTVKPVVILYTSNAEEGVHQIYLATLQLDYRGDLDFMYVRDLSIGSI